MRKYQIHYLTNEARTAAPEAQEHVAKFMDGVSIDNGSLFGSNECIGVHDHVTVLYIPKNYFTDNISTNSFLMEIFDYFTTHFGAITRSSNELMIHSHRARSMLARSTLDKTVISLHPIVVERAVALAHEFMCVLNTSPNHILKHLDIGNTFVILTYGPK